MSEKIRCEHILLEKQSQADRILERITSGENFEELARQYSLDGSKRRGGDLGLFGRGVMVKEFEKAAFALNINEVSPVIKTQFGYHIIKRIDI